jgi:inorganic pyrophosphatase
MANRTDMAKLPAFEEESECWHAGIETPKNSHHKFDYERKLGCFELKRTLPEGMTFPLDFGFIPSTLGR